MGWLGCCGGFAERQLAHPKDIRSSLFLDKLRPAAKLQRGGVRALWHVGGVRGHGECAFQEQILKTVGRR